MATPEGVRERADRLRVLLDVDWDLIGAGITDPATWPVRSRAATDADLAALRRVTADDMGLAQALGVVASEALDRELEAAAELAAEIAIAIRWGDTAAQAVHSVARPDNDKRLAQLLRDSHWQWSPTTRPRGS